MTINDIISQVRISIKEMSNTSLYPDQYLHALISNYRALLLKREMDKNQELSIFNYQTFCYELETTKFHDCSCVNVGCDVLKTIHTVPEFITPLQIMFLDGRSIMYATPEQVKENKYSKSKKDKVAYYYQNDKIILFNTLSQKVILIRGVFADLSNIHDYCLDNGSSCFDITTSDYPLDTDFISVIIKMIKEDIFATKRAPDDKTNNTMDDNES